MLAPISILIKLRVLLAFKVNTKMKTTNQVANHVVLDDTTVNKTKQAAKTIAMLGPQSMLIKRHALLVHLVNIKI